MKRIRFELDKRKVYYTIFIIGLIIFIALIGLYYFVSSSPPSQIINPDPIEQSIYSQEEIRREIKEEVRKEVKKIYDQVEKEVDNLDPDALADAINSELSLFREISRNKERPTSSN